MCSPGNPPRRRPQPGRAAFTLLELMMASVILLILLGVLFTMVGNIGTVLKSSRGRITAFQNARSAFTTINQTLARATLNTYLDYVDAAGNYRTAATSGTFVPAQFTRASELHFLSGPATDLLTAAGSTITNAAAVPGGAIFFQAPLGYANDTSLAGLGRVCNCIGYYVSYEPVDSRLLPSWMTSLFGTGHRFRLLQYVQPSENSLIYNSTSKSTYDLGWMAPFNLPHSATQPRARVVADDVLLLVFRPRLSPKDEASFASEQGLTYSGTAQGSVLCPNYHYDSRAWQSGYPAGERVFAVSSGTARASVMRNQPPPIVDVAMVSADPRSLAHFDLSSDTPPTPLQVPAGLFTDSSKFEGDLATYAQQLSKAKIRFHIFRTSVEIQGARWSNN